MARRSVRAARAFAHLPEVDPGLAALALWCDAVDSPTPQSYTAGETIHIGLDFDTLPLREQIGVLGHHILHIALRHEPRMQSMRSRFGRGFNALTYNLCADALVNHCLIAAGHALPRPVVVLDVLIAQTLPQGVSAGHDLLAIWDVDKLYFRLSGSDQAGRDRQESYQTRTAFRQDLHPETAARDTDDKAATWRAHMMRAEHAAGASGRGIGSHLAQLADITKGQIPWEQHLRALMAKAVLHQPKRTYRRPRSSWVATEAQALAMSGPTPVFEPATQRAAWGARIVVCVDTSASVGTDILALFAGEVVGIANRTGAETHLLCFDETVYLHQRLAPASALSTLMNVDFRRGGGTAFIDVLTQAEALSPSLIVVLTDLEGAFGAPTRAPVIWASPVPVSRLPPFGTVLELIR